MRGWRFSTHSRRRSRTSARSRSAAISCFFICEPGLTEHARERGRACDHAALRLQGGGQFGHGDVRLGFNAPDQKSLVGRQLPAPARAPPLGRLNRPCSVRPLEKLDGATRADPKMPGRVTARMPGPHVPHDARPQIQGITLAHDRSPDHGESSIAAPVTPSRFHLQARRSKHIFQLHGVDAAERPVLRRKLRRRDMIAFFERLSPTRVAIEACGASHHWARLLRGFGHEVQLIAPQLVKPYVKRGKNDAADAEALCEAMSRPTMRFVPVKTAEQQAALMLVGLRDRLIRTRTQLANAIRGYAAAFGITGATGLAHVPALLARIAADKALPALAREVFALQTGEYAQVQAKLAVVEAKLLA